MSEYLVAVQCMTYNQAQYIVDALDGFTMQQTTFPFIVLVVDDASTDGEQETIKQYINQHCDTTDPSVAYEKETEYAHISYSQHRSNRNCYFATLFLKENHYSKHKSKKTYLEEWTNGVSYIALCEGDDYWIDPKKLQRQVDFLETHPDYSICCHRYKIHHQETGLWEEKSYKPVQEEIIDFTFEQKDNLLTWITQPCTMIYRKNCLPDFSKYRYKYQRDVHLAYHLLENRHGYCFQFEGSVYRMCKSGIYASLNEIERMIINCFVHLEIYQKHSNDITLKNKIIEISSILLFEIRDRLYFHKKTEKIFKYIFAHIKIQYKVLGFVSAATSIRKITKSFLLGIVHNKKHQQVIG